MTLFLCRAAGCLTAASVCFAASAALAGNSLDRIDRPTRDVTGRSFALQQRLDQSQVLSVQSIPSLTGEQAKTTLKRQHPNLFALPRGIVEPLPPAPVQLRAVANDAQVTLRWSSGDPNPTLPEKYVVWRSEDNGKSFTLQTHAAANVTQPLPQSETQFQDADVRNGTDYVYTVVAVRHEDGLDVDSNPSNAIKVTPFRAYDFSFSPSAAETQGSFTARAGLKYFNATAQGNKYSVGVGYTHIRNESDASQLDQDSVSASYLLNTTGPILFTSVALYSATQGGGNSTNYTLTGSYRTGNTGFEPAVTYVIKHGSGVTKSGLAPVLEADYTLTSTVDIDAEYDFKTDVTGDDSWQVTGIVAVDPATSVQLGVGKGDTVNIGLTYLFK